MAYEERVAVRQPVEGGGCVVLPDVLNQDLGRGGGEEGGGGRRSQEFERGRRVVSGLHPCGRMGPVAMGTTIHIPYFS